MKLKLTRIADLKVGQKLGLVVLTMALPITALMYAFVDGEVKNVAFATAELNGARMLAPLHEMAREVARYSDQATLYIEGDRNALGRMNEYARKIDQLATSLDELEAELGESLDAEKRWDKVKADWTTLKAGAQGYTREESEKRHAALAEQMLAMNDHVLTVSNLILDPVLETYFIMDTTAVLVPQAIERLAELRNESTGVLKKGDLTADEGIDLSKRIALIENLVSRIESNFAVIAKEDPRLAATAAPALKKLQGAAARVREDIEGVVRESFTLQKLKYTVDGLRDDINRALDDVIAFNELVEPALLQKLEARVAYGRWHMALFAGGGLLLVALAVYFAIFMVRAVTRPLSALTETSRKVAAGERAARARIASVDEVGELGKQFDMMLDQQAALTDKISKENEQLNESVLNLLQAVAKLSQRDLTVRAPVAEDVTGAVADALNLMTDETAKVLSRVVELSGSVAQASDAVRRQADTAMNVALDDKIKVERTATELVAASKAMLEIAGLARSSSEAAAKAIATTDSAQETVLGTVKGITGIRDTIRETEKRIKRLGERSQEIGGVVSLINNIAERTHILALNASMHAASAGEAGRGFAVVANEVQRLAESAREATAQIAGLVNSIQTETADTVTTMNDTISRVVEGTKLAEQAGAQMRETRQSTAELVQYVQRIDESSKVQAEVTGKLVDLSREVQSSAEETYKTLQEQNTHIEGLVGYSRDLAESVGVFTLPKSDVVTPLRQDRTLSTAARRAA